MMSLEHLPHAAAQDGDRLLLANLHGLAVSWLGTCAAYYAASAMYEDLARLSDAELRRRGLRRKTLARDAVDACTRGKR